MNLTQKTFRENVEFASDQIREYLIAKIKVSQIIVNLQYVSVKSHS